MHMRWVAIIGFGLSLNGCYQGYMRPEELDQNERGPKACAASCDGLGMKMSAFVLVERGTAGCVCTPKPTGDRAVREGGALDSKTAAPAEDADDAAVNSIGPVAAYALILQQERAAAQQQAAQQHAK